MVNSELISKACGCLVGGACGDALGYPVEFLTYDEILADYGGNGITEYCLHDGKALISDDTQMTLFTAAGLLLGDRRCGKGGKKEYLNCIRLAYLDWLGTQGYLRSAQNTPLASVPELRATRAPGGTCLSALSSGGAGTIERPINASKGCGGVMRIAPVGLFAVGRMSPEEAAMLGAQAAAITHGHDLGYIPAASAAYIINRLLCGAELKQAVLDSLIAVNSLFPNAIHIKYFNKLIEKAVELADSGTDDINAVNKLGQGWVAEETLAIAVYCSLKHSDSFGKAIIASVNHDGDSDSTGAVTGNILGAYLGFEQIPAKFKENLELIETVKSMAVELVKR